MLNVNAVLIGSVIEVKLTRPQQSSLRTLGRRKVWCILERCGFFSGFSLDVRPSSFGQMAFRLYARALIPLIRPPTT